MNFEDISQKRPLPLKLTDHQQRVKNALASMETEKFPLSDWYVGTLCALDDGRSNERLVHAAHSLREIIEKQLMIIHKTSDHKKIVKGKQEKAKKLIKAGDPMFSQQRKSVQTKLVETLVSLRKGLIAIAHHRSSDTEDIHKCLRKFESIQLGLFSPDTVENQKKILKIIEKDYCIRGRGRAIIFFA